MILENRQNPKIIARLQTPRNHKSHPEQVLVNECAGDERAESLGDRLQSIHQPHDRCAFAGQNDLRQEGGSGRHVGGLETGAEDQKGQCNGGVAGDGDQGEEDGGGKVAKDHCLRMCISRWIVIKDCVKDVR